MMYQLPLPFTLPISCHTNLNLLFTCFMCCLSVMLVYGNIFFSCFKCLTLILFFLQASRDVFLHCTAPLCQFKTSSTAQFCQHINRHFNDPSENCCLLLCPHCTQGFKTGRYWLRHYERVHADQPRTPKSHRENVSKGLRKSHLANDCRQEVGDGRALSLCVAGSW